MHEGLTKKKIQVNFDTPLPPSPPHSLERKGHGRGLRAANLIGDDDDDVKCRNMLSKFRYVEWL